MAPEVQPRRRASGEDLAAQKEESVAVLNFALPHDRDILFPMAQGTVNWRHAGVSMRGCRWRTAFLPSGLPDLPTNATRPGWMDSRGPIVCTPAPRAYERRGRGTTVKIKSKIRSKIK